MVSENRAGVKGQGSGGAEKEQPTKPPVRLGLRPENGTFAAVWCYSIERLKSGQPPEN